MNKIWVVIGFMGLLGLFSIFNTFFSVWTTQGKGIYRFTGYMLKGKNTEWESLFYYEIYDQLQCETGYNDQWCQKIQNLNEAGWVFISFEIFSFVLNFVWSGILVYELRGKILGFNRAFAGVLVLVRVLSIVLWTLLAQNSFFEECEELVILGKLVSSCFDVGLIFSIIILALNLPLLYLAGFNQNLLNI